MPVRQWTRHGYTISPYPQGMHYKYVVYLSATRLIAATTLAELTAELDALVASEAAQ